MVNRGQRVEAKRDQRVEQRLTALEQTIQELQKIVGELKYEVEQMREE